MFKLYSTGCKYTLKALIFMGQERGRPLSAKEICRKAHISEAYTRKTFQALVRGGFLKSGTGPGGGYTLAGDPEKISVLSIIEAVDGKERRNECVMGLPRCNEKNPCPLHFTWVDSKEKLYKDLQKKTLKDLIAASRKKKAKAA